MAGYWGFLMIKGVFFDFDGTIADSSEGIFHTALYTIRALGITEEYSESDLRKFVGPPLRDCFRVAFGLDPSLIDDAVSIYREEYLRTGYRMMRLYPGIKELLGKLHADGIMTGVATFKGEGVSELTSDPSALTFSLGAIAKPVNHLEEVKKLLGCMGTVVVEKNFLGARWSKLLINSAFSGLSTVTGATFGEVARNKASRRVAQRIIKECIDVAKAAGITIEPVQGHKIDKLFDYRGPLKKAISFALIPVAMKKHAALVASMLQDIRAGKKCEIDAINGVVCDFGRKYGVPTPFCERTVGLVHLLEEGAPITFTNIGKYSDLFRK